MFWTETVEVSTSGIFWRHVWLFETMPTSVNCWKGNLVIEPEDVGLCKNVSCRVCFCQFLNWSCRFWQLLTSYLLIESFMVTRFNQTSIQSNCCSRYYLELLIPCLRKFCMFFVPLSRLLEASAWYYEIIFLRMYEYLTVDWHAE